MIHLSHVLLAVILLTTAKISGQFFPAWNNHYFSGNVPKTHDSAVKAGELIAESCGTQGPAPCRNKDANKQHKDSLWWTLPIPPMELEGQPDKPQQIKLPEQVNMEKSQSSVEGGVIQTKHTESSSTVKAIASVTVAAQIATTGKHESPSTTVAAAPKQDHGKTQQVQQQAQGSAPPPNQLVVSNRENANQLLISNKSVATLRTPVASKNLSPNQHSSGKQRAQFNYMVGEPMELQYWPDFSQLQGSNQWINNPYCNIPFPAESKIDTKRDYRSTDLQQELSDINIYRDFDNTDTEIGGGNFIGEHAALENKPQSNYAAIQNPEQGTLQNECRNRRNSQTNLKTTCKKIAIS